MPTLKSLRGLQASDRTQEDQRAINDIMGYKEDSGGFFDGIIDFAKSIVPNGVLAGRAAIQRVIDDPEGPIYANTYDSNKDKYGINVNTINTGAIDYIDKIGRENSSYYKKYKGTDKLPLNYNDYKVLAAGYDTIKESRGEDAANMWLDRRLGDKVAENQSWFEQAVNGVSHLMPAIEGGLMQTIGMLAEIVDPWGVGDKAMRYIAGEENTQSQDLNWWDSWMDRIIDNPLSRYGRDLEHAGASHVQDALKLIGLSDETANERIANTKATATKYNPEGIGEDAIVTTEEQDNSLINSATPWQALQSGGFTALSMLTGAGEAKIAQSVFGGLAKGAMWLNRSNKILNSYSKVKTALQALKKAQNFTELTIIPGLVGSAEGVMEGLNTKIEVEREAKDKLEDYYQNKVKEKAAELIQTGNAESHEDAIMKAGASYQDEYDEALRQIDWASSKAGIHNFYANSLINGMMNTTLKAGIMSPRVQETIRNSKMFGWAYKNSKFNIDAAGKVTPKTSKLGSVLSVLKEPVGEGFEEYSQSVSEKTFSGAAENNIDEFIKNKFDGEGTAKVTDTFGSDYAAALTALENSLTDKESIQSAILGAVSSTMGTVGGIGRGYHRDENGKLVQNSMFSPNNLTRSLNSDGKLESMSEYFRRVTPWRSGAINAYYDRKREKAEAEETAATMTEWLKDPQNKAKWDGLVGTANWMTQMENAAESNDQFSYRKAQMGKAINDVFMLSKMKGTDYYDSMMTDLQRASSGEVTAEEIQKIRQNGGEEYQDVSDQEIVEKTQSNANKMLGLMSQVEQEGKSIDRMIGRVDEDTKQSLIFGKIMEQDFTERRDQLQEEIDQISRSIQSSASRSNASLDDDLKKLIMTYGSVNKALKAQSDMLEQKEKLEKKIDELEKIDPEKTSDKQKEELIKSKVQLKKIDNQLKSFDGLYKKDEKGNRTDEIDTGLYNLVLNEEEIMQLDPVTRAMVLAQGANKLYNATHQNRQKVDQLNLEIDDINHQIDALEAQKQKWTKDDGRIKKGHNKQYQRNDKKIAELRKQKESKMRQLDAEQGKQNSKPIYNSAQQAVIDNLVQQGMAQDADFLDKVVDMGRLDKGIKDYHTQYLNILSDPKAYHNYVQRAKYNAQRDLTRRRAERVAGIQDYQEYAQELDRLTANASQQEMNEILQILRQEDVRQKKQYQQDNMVVDPETGDLVPGEAPKTNYDRYKENIKQQGELVRQFAKNPNLTDNDQSLLLNAMQYLSSKGIDMTDRDAAVQALLEKDEEGNIGGNFRKFVEAKNDMMPEQQRAFMPVFTSIGQVVSQYVDIIKSAQEDAINRGNIKPTITATTSTTPQDVSQQSTVVPAPSPSAPAAPEAQSAGEASLFAMGDASKANQDVQVDDNGTVATGSQTQAMQERQKQQTVAKSTRQQQWEQVTTPDIAAQVDASSDMISTSSVTVIETNRGQDKVITRPATQEEKNLALQYLDEISVNSDERLETIDDVLDAIQQQVNRLQEISNNQKEENNPYSIAAGLLQKVYGSLSAKKMRGRRRSARIPSSRPANTKASLLETADIWYMEQKNPDAWAVQFTNEHDIEEKNAEMMEKGVITTDTPIYFITDSVWTAEVTRQMRPATEVQSISPKKRDKKGYDRLTDLPIVVAVRVEAPADPVKTTAIEVNGLWYQPIGVLPSTEAEAQGAERTFAIRQLASKEQGRHLITENGMPNGSPLTTRVYGANWLVAHHRDQSNQIKRQNTPETNTEVIEDILNNYLPRESAKRLRALPKEEMLNDSEYMEARNKFLNNLGWGTNPKYPDNLAYTPDNYRQGETGNPMLVFTIPMAETTGRTDSRTLPEVLENGTGEEVRTFNSRTQRLYDEIIRPLFQYIPYNPISNSGDRNDKSAKIITQDDLTANPNAYQEEADRLTQLLNGFDGTEGTKGLKGISDFIYVKPGYGWSIKVTAPEALQVAGDMQTSQSVYKVFFINQDSSIAPIEIGTIHAGQRDTGAAFELLRNIMWDGQQVRDFLNWQTPKADAQNINNPDKEASRRPRQNYAAMVDDGILLLAGSSLVYDVDGVKLQAPINNDGKIVYPYDTIVNPVNATPAAPQNVTPQGDGAIVTDSGQPIDPNSGANLGDNNPPAQPRESEKLRKAKEITSKIVADSKEFTLSEDETYYYVTDKNTGEQTKYLRVTTVISADETAPQWEPSIKEIYDKLSAKHSLREMSSTELANTYKSIDQMSQDLNIPIAEIRRAIAELRTEHKHTKYGAWSVPSTAVGNTADTITRDFFANELKDSYPNITKEALNKFVEQLTRFKYDLISQGITIVPQGVMAHGTITMTDSEGNQHDVKVAGTLDLFGYDNDGNFYIFDMKTTRNHSQNKLLEEKDKWSRQISMYADLLKQSYPGFNVDPRNLRIIPINVDYPTPMGSRNDHLDPSGPQYSVDDSGQLLMTFRGTAGQNQPFDGSNLSMRGHTLAEQFPVGHTAFKINWDNLSSEDQDIADALATQTGDANISTEGTPQNATIETPVPQRPSFIAADAFINDYTSGTQEAAPQAPPITPAGTSPILPSWNNLTKSQKERLESLYGEMDAEYYGDLLNIPSEVEIIKKTLKCSQTM